MAWTLTIRAVGRNRDVYEVDYVINDDNDLLVERGHTTVPIDDTPTLAADRIRAILEARQKALTTEPLGADAGSPFLVNQVFTIPARIKADVPRS